MCLDTTSSQRFFTTFWVLERLKLLTKECHFKFYGLLLFRKKHFEAQADKDLFQNHQWLIKQKYQGPCLYKMYDLRSLSSAVLLAQQEPIDRKHRGLILYVPKHTDSLSRSHAHMVSHAEHTLHMHTSDAPANTVHSCMHETHLNFTWIHTWSHTLLVCCW